MDAERVKRDMLELFEFSHNREDWVNPLAEALEGISAEQAASPAVAPDLRSIWEIVLHMTVWSGHIERWYPGYEHNLPEGTTPPLPTRPDQVSWDAARQRLIDQVGQMRAEIEAMPAGELLVPATEGTTLFEEYLGRMIHNAYHIGQLTVLRECVGKPPAGSGPAGSGA
jgi:hypothetical protein